jgi:hypothetical protein
MHYPEFVLGNRIRRTNLRACRIFTMHTNLNGRLRRKRSFDVIDADHRKLAVGFALRTGHLTGVAANASLRVDKELLFGVELKGRHGNLSIPMF